MTTMAHNEPNGGDDDNDDNDDGRDDGNITIK